MPGACSSSIFRKSAAKEIGLFDEGLRGSAEDWEFFMRMARSGDFDFVDEVLVQIRKHKSSRSTVKPLIWLKDNNKALNQGFKKTPEYGSFGLLRSKAYLLHVFTRSLLRKWLLRFISVSNGTSDK
jgi:GT2 family glycosyltransferase